TLWIERRQGRSPASESGRSISRNEQLLDEHLAEAETAMAEMLARMTLPDEVTEALRVALALHDAGKAAEVWQRAFHGSPAAPIAKSKYPCNPAALGGYRHELGSLPRMERHPRFE